MKRLIRRGTVALDGGATTRRDFCQLVAAASASAAIVQLVGCGDSGGGCDDAATGVDLAAPADLTMAAACAGMDSGMKPGDFAVGTATFFTTGHNDPTNAFVCRDAGGLFAMSSACTHEFCDVRFLSQATGYRCPCHGARFDFVGNVTQGPAIDPLVHYAMCRAPSGTVSFDVNTTVDAAKRYTF